MQSTAAPHVTGFRRMLLPSLASAVVLASCNQGGSSPPVQVQQGLGVDPATGMPFVFEPFGHQGGQAANLGIANVVWGRLVDVLDRVVDDNGTPGDPTDDVVTESVQFEDFLIGQDITSDGQTFELRRDPITGRESVVVLHPAGSAAFADALERLEANLQPLLVKGLGSNVAPPFSGVPRNASLAVVFDDLIDPASVDPTTVVLRVGNPPTSFFESRILPDPNHGAVVGGAFAPSRVLIDPTISELDAQGGLLKVNSLGLPAAPVATQGNVSIGFPTTTNAVVGQTKVLQNLSGHAVSPFGNGPLDPSSATDEVVRVFRSGLGSDPANGFLPDALPPRLIGVQAVSITSVSAPLGPDQDEFLIGARFATPSCATAAGDGDVFRTTQVFVEVVAPGSLAGADLTDVRVRVISGPPSSLTTGPADHLAPYEPGLDTPACFVRFQPPAGTQPDQDVPVDAQILVRFSEPMDPASVLAFDTFTVRPQDTAGLSPIEQRIAATIEPSSDFREFRLDPAVDLAHAFGTAETYEATLGGQVTDLAGNRVVQTTGTTTFTVDPNAPTVDAGNLVLSFSSTDEDQDGAPETTGNFLLDFSDPNGRVRPRDVQRFSTVVDGNRPINSPMQLVANPIITPHVPLGSRMQAVWRIYELGLGLHDPTTWDIDVEGLNWAPFGGSVQLDRFENFEIRLAHAGFLPDEEVTAANLPQWPNSGLLTTFDSNRLDPGLDPPVVVHPSEQGYVIQPLDVFPASTGTAIIPWPLNRDKPVSEFVTFTWRDTSIPAVGGPNGRGADIGRYQTLTGDTTNDGAYAPDQVPTIGLPLLMEFRCQPDTSAFGQNGVQLAIALTSSAQPFFRALSSGGFDSSGTPVTVDPENAPQATGGFGVAGNQTMGTDNAVHFGQADFVVRVSRMHTAWFDTRATTGATWGQPVVEPEVQPLGTSVTLAFRGADSITGPFGNANHVGAYGNSDASAVDTTSVIAPQFLGGDSAWKPSLAQLDGARYVQVRVTFVSNIESLLSPTLSALGLAFTR